MTPKKHRSSASGPGDAKPATRLARGKVEGSAGFPVAPPRAGLPGDYAEVFGEIKRRIGQERLRTLLAANAAMVELYWDVGRMILDRQAQNGWGAKVIDRLSEDLRLAYPEMKGLSARNLKYMRAFAAAWPERSIVQAPLAQLTWYHHLTLLEKVGDPKIRLWYAAKTVRYGWSRNILYLQIQNQAHRREGAAQNNFQGTLPALDSDMAAQVFKDPYLFDFLGTAAPRREAELERGLVDHIQGFLIELGRGFAFVGRQVHLEIGDETYCLDLLFYHLKLRRYVVIELKARKFTPGDGAQLGMYMTAVDRLLAHPDDKPTLGLLLVREKNRTLVEYALGGSRQPISVAEWETQLVESLPEEFKGSLPTVEELEAELGDGHAFR